MEYITKEAVENMAKSPNAITKGIFSELQRYRYYKSKLDEMGTLWITSKHYDCRIKVVYNVRIDYYVIDAVPIRGRKENEVKRLNDLMSTGNTIFWIVRKLNWNSLRIGFRGTDPQDKFGDLDDVYMCLKAKGTLSY